MMQPSPSRTQSQTTVLPGALKIFLLLSIALTLLSFIYSLLCRHWNLGLPYSFPYYYVPGDMFQDFFAFNEKIKQFGTPAFFGHRQYGYFMYPAPLVHVFRLFLHPAHHARTYFIYTLLSSSALLAAAFAQTLRKHGLATLQSVLLVGSVGLLSYPFLYLIQRWNIEFLIWIVSTLGVWSFFTGRPTRSALWLGVAASLKLYPFIFLGLFLPRKKYLQFLLGIVTAVFITVVSLYAIGPSIAAAFRWDNEQIQAFSKYYVGALWALGYDHSFFGLVKAFTLHWHPDLFAWAHPYTLIMAISCVVLYFTRIWWMPLPNQILALSVLSVTIAPVSYDYTLLNLYPAFAVLTILALQAQRRGTTVPGLNAYMVLFAFIFTPESYVIYHAVRYGAQVRAICLLIMLVLALRKPLPEYVRPGLDDRTPEPA